MNSGRSGTPERYALARLPLIESHQTKDTFQELRLCIWMKSAVLSADFHQLISHNRENAQDRNKVLIALEAKRSRDRGITLEPIHLALQ